MGYPWLASWGRLAPISQCLGSMNRSNLSTGKPSLLAPGSALEIPSDFGDSDDDMDPTEERVWATWTPVGMVHNIAALPQGATRVGRF